MGWSPDMAMKAYLHTLRLCKDNYIQDCTLENSRLIEPKCMEYISALAAGNQAQLMVEIPSGGISPLTIALAVAAKHTGGHLICILSKQEVLDESKIQIAIYSLEDVVEFLVGDPCEVIKKYRNIDFAIVDCKLENYLKLLRTIDVNPNGSVVVVNNVFHRKIRASYVQVFKGSVGIESVTLLQGEGMEVIKVGWKNKNESRASKRSHVRSLRGE